MNEYNIVTCAYYWEDFDYIFGRAPSLIEGFEELAKLLKIQIKTNKVELAVEVNDTLRDLWQEKGYEHVDKIIRRAQVFRKQYKVCLYCLL
jgi:hypothetical protein